MRAAAGDDTSGKDGGGQEEEEGEWRRFGSGRLEEDEEEQFGGVEDDVERIGLTLPEISNPFKAAFEAGQTLRSTLADTLGQITGTASPVSFRRRMRVQSIGWEDWRVGKFVCHVHSRSSRRWDQFRQKKHASKLVARDTNMHD